MVNKVILIGNVGKDPEVKYFDSGSCVTKFSLATTESYKDKQGNKVSNTEWHNVELWEGLAKVAEQYVKKGDKLYIEGKIKTEKYTGQDGIEKSTVKIRATQMTMLGGAAGNQQQGQIQSAQPSKTDDFKFTEESKMDDLPFEMDDLPF